MGNFYIHSSLRQHLSVAEENHMIVEPYGQPNLKCLICFNFFFFFWLLKKFISLIGSESQHTLKVEFCSQTNDYKSPLAIELSIFI